MPLRAFRIDIQQEGSSRLSGKATVFFCIFEIKKTPGRSRKSFSFIDFPKAAAMRLKPVLPFPTEAGRT
jgi:hypothetical protein